MWGQIHRELYELYADRLNADLHEVVPKKIVAFRGPRDLGGRLYRDDAKNWLREFDPAYYLEIFDDLDVSTVIRLNQGMYDSKVYTDHGIEHHELYFEDCAAPQSYIVERFFDIVHRAKGAVAVHCTAGLGRTGTLAALFLVRAHGFTAREAIGWVRIMRPGSVIGVQQDFLCFVEAQMQNTRLARTRAPPARKLSRSASTRSIPSCPGEATSPPGPDVGMSPGSPGDDSHGPSCKAAMASGLQEPAKGPRRHSIAAAELQHLYSRRPRPPSLCSVLGRQAAGRASAHPQSEPTAPPTASCPERCTDSN